MSPQLGKLGTRHRGPFSRKICVSQATEEGLEPMRGHQTGVYGRLLPDAIFCQNEHWAAFCLFVQTQTGRTFLSPILLAC